jgi:hypothetical protein
MKPLMENNLKDINLDKKIIKKEKKSNKLIFNFLVFIIRY